MKPIGSRWLLAALVVIAVLAIAVSRRTSPAEVVGAAERPAGTVDELLPADIPVLGDRAPAIRSDQWLNTEPLTPDDLRGKVVLYDFWTFGCINCRNTLPWVKAWHSRYAADGLVVLSIHTPEFDYEADPANVREYVTNEGIEYPVALDPDKVNWRAFSNHYWPAFYLYDREGQRRYVHFGEGAYDDTESTIRALLGVDASSPRVEVTS